MKTVEQKAKAYDKAVKEAYIAYKDEDKHLKATLERIFPELGETEDERTRKDIIRVLKGEISFTSEKENEKYIAWLEKQGEPKYTKKDVDDAYLKGISDTKNEIEKQYEANYQIRKDIATFIFNYRGDLKDRAKWMDYLGIKLSFVKEKQKPNKKIEPKFHEGEWVVYNRDICQIVKREEGCNKLVTVFGIEKELVNERNLSTAHLWTIQDAKDGDVLVDKSDGTIGIFQSIGHHPDGGSYNDPSYCFLHCHYDDGFFYADFEHGNTMDSDDAIPATKEQRDLLFQKMSEAGYEWDANKKELKKIKQNSTIFIPKFRVRDKLISTRNPRLTYEVLEVGHINELGNPEYKVEIFADGKSENHSNILYMECCKVDEWAKLIEQKPIWTEKG